MTSAISKLVTEGSRRIGGGLLFSIDFLSMRNYLDKAGGGAYD
jgi:hypothetical protein